jgi:hypothetical protein
MIYLRRAFAVSGLPVPAKVAVVVDDVDWLVAQVHSEMQALFPAAQVHMNPEPGSGGAGSPDLLVAVYPAGSQPEDHLARLGARARQARTGVALYCVDDRRFEVVAAGDLGRWEKQQRRRRAVLGWSRRAPAVWNRVVRRLVAS